jgi:hypothetical protein
MHAENVTGFVSNAEPKQQKFAGRLCQTARRFTETPYNLCHDQKSRSFGIDAPV